MKESLILLGLSRLDSIRKKADEVSLIDRKEIILRKELSDFTDKLVSLDRSLYSDDQNNRFFSDIQLVIGWYNALIDNLNTRLSKPIIELLKQISKDWIDAYDNRVLLVTVGDYATQAGAKIANERFNSDYSISLSILPLILFVPPHQSDDLFLGVALLHELGHMIDYEWGVTSSVVSYIIRFCKSGQFKDVDCNPYFSDIKSINVRHLRELFADIFGAQYCKESILANVEYWTTDPDASFPSHPSYNNRLNAVRDFLNNVTTNNYSSKFIKLMAFVMEKVINKPLRVIDETNDEPSFEKGELIEFTTKEQLYSIFHDSWRAYEKGPRTLDRYNTINSIALRSLDNHFRGS